MWAGQMNKDDIKTHANRSSESARAEFIRSSVEILWLKRSSLPAGTGKTHHLIITKYMVKWEVDEVFSMKWEGAYRKTLYILSFVYETSQ